MQTPSIDLLFGISKHKYYAIANCCEGILNLILSIILVNIYGIYGVAMATMIEMIIFKLLIQPVYTCRAISLTAYDYYFRTIFMTGFKTMLPLLLYFYIAKDYLQPEYMRIFIISIIQLFLFLPIIFFAVLGKKERRHIKLAMGII
jgi:O-antigen/teichoic acid export membrane protein